MEGVKASRDSYCGCFPSDILLLFSSFAPDVMETDSIVKLNAATL
jgi:hypothetical protein